MRSGSGAATSRAGSSSGSGPRSSRRSAGLWQRIVEANRPGPAEHSIAFRTATVGAVTVALAACWSQGELSAPVALGAVIATVVGNVLSYRRRERPWVLVKPILAVCVVAGFAWFILSAAHQAAPGNVSTVERPLAFLFAWVLCTHAFDVPARKDVAYTLAGSVALMAVAAAQTVDLSLAGYVVVWFAFGIWGLVAMWQSLTGVKGVPWGALGASSVVVVVLALVFLVLLPAPRVSSTLIFPASSAGDAPVDSPSGLTDGAASLPATAAAPSGPTRVGGYLGFAKSLDTGLRASLGNQVVLRVRASQPSYWVGETFDHWNGKSWTQTTDPSNGGSVTTLAGGSPFSIPTTTDQSAPDASGTTDVQTFYLAESGPNLVFHADNATRVYVESPRLLLTGDGTIVSPLTMGKGTVYTVVSDVNTATPAQLRAATRTSPRAPGTSPAPHLSTAQRRRYLQLAGTDPRVAALAAKITAGIGTPENPDTYDKVMAIEHWMATHIHYSTDIPPLAPGQNTVDEFLFHTRVGYCEQISTATAVMLRTLGIPVREATGYVPGSYNPITDLYDVEAKDAHAWVQVWFPGYGWQNFDPTADVPLANPSPGSVLVRDLGNGLRHLPVVPLGIVVTAVAGLAELRRRHARRPRTWAERVVRDFERHGARAGRPRAPSETLRSYASRLAGSESGLVWAADLVEAWRYGGIEPSAGDVERAVQIARHAAVPGGHQGEAPNGRGEPQPERAYASANDPPAATRDR